MEGVNFRISANVVPTIAYSTRSDLTQFGDWTYTYDAAGNMIRAHNTQSNVLAKYWRDADGHRAVKDVDGAKTVFFNLGTTQLEAYDVLTDMASSTIYEPGIDRPLAEVSSSGTLTFYHQDWLGNLVMLTNAAGAKVQTYTYDVWGKPSGFDASGLSLPVSGFSSRLLYTGREYDRETSLYHYRARAYSPSLGRFLQTDPIDFDAGDVNLFRYVGNNPINLWDSYGLCEEGETDPLNDLWDALDAISVALLAVDVALAGPTGEGIIPALAIQAGKYMTKRAIKAAKKLAKAATKKKGLEKNMNKQPGHRTIESESKSDNNTKKRSGAPEKGDIRRD